MKTCLLPARNSPSVRTIYTIFSVLCSTNIELFNCIRYIGAYDTATLRSHFPLNRVYTFTPQNGGKVTPDVTSNLISVN